MYDYVYDTVHGKYIADLCQERKDKLVRACDPRLPSHGLCPGLRFRKKNPALCSNSVQFIFYTLIHILYSKQTITAPILAEPPTGSIDKECAVLISTFFINRSFILLGTQLLIGVL